MINTPKIYKMRIVYRWMDCASGKADGVSVLRERIRQSGLAYVPVKGAVTTPRVSYGPSVGRGLCAEREYADIYLRKRVEVEQIRNCLTDPGTGLEVLEVTRVPYGFASVQYLASAAVYRIEGNFAAYPHRPTAMDYFNALQVKITRQSPNGMSWVTDVKPYIRTVEQVSPRTVRLTLQRIEEKWINPQELVAAWLGTNPQALSGVQIIREGLYWQDAAGELHLI